MSDKSLLVRIWDAANEDTIRLDELSSGSRFTGRFDYLTSEWTVTINDEPYYGKTLRQAIDQSIKPNSNLKEQTQ